MRTLYAATGDAFACIRDDGGIWRASLSLQGKGVQCLALDPLNSASVYAGTRGNGVWRSRDGGVNWRNIVLPQPDVFSLAVSAADGAVYAGTEPSHLFVSRDGGETWRELHALLELPSYPEWRFPPRPWTSHVRSIAPSPHDAGLLLAGIELGGLMRSLDGGESWQDHRPGAQRDVHALAWHPNVPGRAYEAGGGGAAWSRDGGDKWFLANEGRDRDYCWGLAVDPDDPDTWFTSAAAGPRRAHGQLAAHAAIYRWRGGGPWEELKGRLPQQPLKNMPRALAAARGQLFAGFDDGRIYASQDGGDDWNALAMHGDHLSRVEALAAAD
ncbi:hypothetical protein KEU06_20605 [Pseudaminobacter sp. 19-2017]|uniref:Exo-alpha-sialidase n=1 Tax=Pseudaminobacter soli (ex Zhang et al. 2022) TaxID=2831468 RepID=A0A942E5P7_9HYPH|nr:hypothetical protein [Pseudaminobacter soli]MBS3651015.1 hypothetical protein [Pseudaminobacter soli]